MQVTERGSEIEADFSGGIVLGQPEEPEPRREPDQSK